MVMEKGVNLFSGVFLVSSCSYQDATEAVQVFLYCVRHQKKH